MQQWPLLLLLAAFGPPWPTAAAATTSGFGCVVNAAGVLLRLSPDRRIHGEHTVPALHPHGMHQECFATPASSMSSAGGSGCACVLLQGDEEGHHKQEHVLRSSPSRESGMPASSGAPHCPAAGPPSAAAAAVSVGELTPRTRQLS